MVDFEKIGRRIKEERKLNKRVSQERMALDLGMYQADISNLEKAKSGSGIGDLYKLDLIADYFNIPLAALIFGMEEDKMVHYYGNNVRIKEAEKPVFNENMKNTLDELSGFKSVWKTTSVFEWGPYKIYMYPEYQQAFPDNVYFAGDKIMGEPDFVLPKGHCFITLDEEILAVMVFSVIDPILLINQEALEMLQTFIPKDIMDVTDLLRTINPYWALYTFGNESDKDNYRDPLLKRMDEIKSIDSLSVIFIESVYVREDCRQHGLLRLFLDLIDHLFPHDHILWLNLEPTSGEELHSEAGYHPSYEASDLGQISMNAAIAERIGFTIDSKIVKRQIENEDEDGNISVTIAEVRNSAYYFPDSIRNLLHNDNDLVAIGRAKEQLQKDNSEGGFCLVGFRNGKEGDYVIYGRQDKGIGIDEGKERWLYAAMTPDREYSKFGVTPFNPFDRGINHKGQIFCCDYLDESEDTEYYDDFLLLLNFVQTLLVPNPEDNDQL